MRDFALYRYSPGHVLASGCEVPVDIDRGAMSLRVCTCIVASRCARRNGHRDFFRMASVGLLAPEVRWRSHVERNDLVAFRTDVGVTAPACDRNE